MRLLVLYPGYKSFEKLFVSLTFELRLLMEILREKRTLKATSGPALLHPQHSALSVSVGSPREGPAPWKNSGQGDDDVGACSWLRGVSTCLGVWGGEQTPALRQKLGFETKPAAHKMSKPPNTPVPSPVIWEPSQHPSGAAWRKK